MLKFYYTDRLGQDEHEIGQALAEFVIRGNFAASGGEGCEPRLCYDDRGKPGVSIPGAYVSISHSGAFCAVAISDGEVGVDLEVIGTRTPERMSALAKRYFSEAERDFSEQSPIPNFYMVWCAKESYVKLTGEGISRGLSSFSTVKGELGVHFQHFKLGGIFEDGTDSEAIGCVCSQNAELCELDFIPLNKFYITEEAL